MKIHCKFDTLALVNELKPNPFNRNKHSKEQIDRLAKLLEYQGIRAPIIVSSRSQCIVKGHGTLEAIKKNGWPEAPIVYQDFTNEEQEYSFCQSDNAIANWAELDLGEINNDLGILGPDLDIELLGIEEFTVDPSEKESQPKDEQAPILCDNCKAIIEE